MSMGKGAVATQRLFFALQPQPELQERITRVASALLPDRGLPVRVENVHCTLVFLGEVEMAKRLCLEDAASRVRVEPFQLTFDHLGYFRRPQVAWLGCASTPVALQTLVAGLQEAAAACGFPPERRPYAVHLTVVRKLRSDPGPLRCMPFNWFVNQFVLMESIREANRVLYKPLRRWEL